MVVVRAGKVAGAGPKVVPAALRVVLRAPEILEVPEARRVGAGARKVPAVGAELVAPEAPKVEAGVEPGLAAQAAPAQRDRAVQVRMRDRPAEPTDMKAHNRE